MFKPVFVEVWKSRPSIIWGVNIHALDRSAILLLQRLQRQQVVAVDERVVEDVAIAARLGVVAQFLVLDQDARL